jgi:hypothetical protein
LYAGRRRQRPLWPARRRRASATENRQHPVGVVACLNLPVLPDELYEEQREFLARRLGLPSAAS